MGVPLKDLEARRAFDRARGYEHYQRTLARQRATWTEEQWAAFRERECKRSQAWRKKYPERHRANSKAWEQAHAEKERLRKRQWMRDHAAERKPKAADYYKRNKEEILRKTDAYRKAHPEMNAAMQSKRRAARKGAPVNDFTAQQWASMKEHYRHCCVYCGKKQKRLTQDHIVPLIKGGSHTYSNIVPACRSCNAKKGTGAVLVPVQPLLLIA
jgi:5-methylcytosine-specific restriction endonuclease McrA